MKILRHLPSLSALIIATVCAFSVNISNGQTISTIAGGSGPAYSGDGAVATAAHLNSPSGVFVNVSGEVFIADGGNGSVRKITTDGVIHTVAGNGTNGFAGDGYAATAAKLNNPQAVITDAVGNIYIADHDNHRVRKVNSAGIITTIAGTGVMGFGGDGGPATAAKLNYPSHLLFDAAGNLLIADAGNGRIRSIDPAGNISTTAGGGGGGLGDGGPATAAGLYWPRSMVYDAGGNMYIGDELHNRVRKITPAGIISTIAGTGSAGSAGDGGPATAAQLNEPTVVDIDGAGNLYIAEFHGHRIRKINTSGAISTWAGNGVAGYSGDGGPAVSAQLNKPLALYCTSGNLYIADNANNAVRATPICIAPVVGLINGPGNICQGDTVRLTDTVAGGVWTSSNPAVASIDFSGLVTGLLAGTDTVKYAIYNECGSDSATLILNVNSKRTCDSVTAVNSIITGESYRVALYPNPCDGDFSIRISSASQEPAQIVVYDLVGKVVEEISISTNADHQLQLNTPPGVYYLHVKTRYPISTQKIIVR